MKSKVISMAAASCRPLAATLVAMFMAAEAPAQDLSALPDYQPQQQLSGVLRSRGEDNMGELMKLWEQGFKKYHPNVQFEDTLKGSSSGMYGIEMRTADMALMGRPVNPFERYGTYERGWAYAIEIEVATGSAVTPSKSAATAILVQRDNPITKLTMKQLDGIFGAERTGGWVALRWNEKAARGPEGNIRTWRQLGVSGPLADQPVHVYGPPNRGAGEVSYFESRVFGGARIWNEDLREYPDPAKMMAALSSDPLGIGYAALGDATAGVKPVAIADGSGPYVELTKTNVANRSYPLTHSVYIYYALDNPKAELTGGDPRVKEFLRYILSKEGQQAVAREGSYLPLTAAVVREQLAKMDSKEEPPEHKVLD